MAMTREAAEEIAVAALGHIAAEPELLDRFLALTGIAPSDIRHVAGEPGFMAGVLAFVVQHEPTLTAFAAGSGIPPERVTEAWRSLPGGGNDWMGSV